MEFYDRTDELAALEERWASPRGEFLVLYGRRRVGKSHLIARFAAERRHLVFEATSGSERDHLDDVSAEIARVSGRAIYAEQPLGSWRAVFTAFEELIGEGPILIALDEFQFIARQTPEIGSLINRFYERQRASAGLMLILSGSDVGFFEREVVAYGATSYGRRTGAIRLEPFAWTDARAFVPGWSTPDAIRAWSVFGGMPYYLAEIAPERPLAENIGRVICRPDGLLRREPEFLLSQETRIRDRDPHMSALRAIAQGHTRLGEIAQRMGRPADEARPRLEVLESMGLVRRSRPVVGASPQRVRYAISDPFLRFWFRFVGPYEARLATRAFADAHLAQTVMPQLDHFVSGAAFEEVAQAWALAAVPGAVAVGRWWGSRKERGEGGKVRDRQYEADVVPVNGAGKVLALGSCKWSEKVHPAGELDKLETITGMLADADLLASAHPPLLFFDRTGFSPRLTQIAAARADVHLIELDTLTDSQVRIPLP